MKSILSSLQSWISQFTNIIQSIIAMSRLAWQAQPSYFISLVLITLLQGFYPLALAWLMKLLFDLLASDLNHDAGFSLQLWLILAAQAALIMTGRLLAQVGGYLDTEMNRQLILTVQFKIYHKVSNFTGLSPFENPKLYNTIQLANEGAQGANQTISYFTTLIQSTVTLVSFVGILLSFNLALTVLVILAALPQLYTQLKFGRQRVQLADKISLDQRKNSYFSSLLSGGHAAKETRLFDTGNYFLGRLLQLTQKVHQERRRQQKYELRWNISLGLLSSLVSSIAFVVVVLEAFNGHLTLGDVTLYISAVASVQNALSGNLFAISGLHESSLLYTYFTNLMTLPDSLPLTSQPRHVEKLMSGVELRNVSFRYSEQHPWVLRDVNLLIPVGQCLALVGLNGAGKTTLIKLLLRFYDPTEGDILWDGIDIREFTPKDLRQRMGAIFQDYLRYDLTVQENIGLGCVKHIDNINLIRQAAINSGAHKMIEKLPQGYQTELSLIFANGKPPIDLSGGQWQKIATARLFMRDADLLILDEPTAALDAQAEHENYARFSDLINGQTTLLISHRFSTVRMADMIAVLENGRITEYGSHDELLSFKGNYAKLYKMQAEKYSV